MTSLTYYNLVVRIRAPSSLDCATECVEGLIKFQKRIVRSDAKKKIAFEMSKGNPIRSEVNFAKTKLSRLVSRRFSFLCQEWYVVNRICGRKYFYRYIEASKYIFSRSPSKKLNPLFEFFSTVPFTNRIIQSEAIFFSFPAQ